MASLEETLLAFSSTESAKLAEEERQIDEELLALQNDYWIFNDNLNTDHAFTRRLESTLFYLMFRFATEVDEYSFFLANLEYYNDKTKADVLPKVTLVRDTLNKLISKLS